MKSSTGVAWSHVCARLALGCVVTVSLSGCTLAEIGGDDFSDQLARDPCRVSKGKGGGGKGSKRPDAGPCPDAGVAPVADAAPPPPPPTDAAPADPIDAAPPAVDAAPPPPQDCIDYNPSFGSGKHNAGRDCTGCHGPGGNAVRFYVGGTLYDSLSGSNPVSGATIRVVDRNGVQLDLVTHSNGNFYTTRSVAYPITVFASSCPDKIEMIGQVDTSDSCNTGGCHDSGNRIYLQ